MRSASSVGSYKLKLLIRSKIQRTWKTGNERDIDIVEVIRRTPSSEYSPFIVTSNKVSHVTTKVLLR